MQGHHPQGDQVMENRTGHEVCIDLGGKGAPHSPSDAALASMPCTNDLGYHMGMRVTLQDLSYTVRSHHNKKVELSLLSSVSGFLNPGQMSALMGPSGSGKTTLLDVLAGRKTTGRIDGSVLFEGVKPSRTFLRRYTGYVEQFDTLVDTLTVEEMLLYTAELKRPLQESAASKRQAVDALIRDLSLEGCRATLIGNVLHRGISGGQCKRTNIGVALITGPRVLFMDEPTSGLDSYTSNEVMTMVKRLAKTGITVCATIHSPTPTAFRLFDRLMLLLSGRVVYFGEQGHQAVEYFNALPALGEGLALEPLQEGNNEAEWIVNLTTQADRRGRAGAFAAMYEGSTLKAGNDAEVKGALRQGNAQSTEAMAEVASQHATVTPFWWGIWVMLRYRTTKNYRSSEYLGPRVGANVAFTLLVISLYWGTGNNFATDNIVNIAAVLFSWCLLPAFGASSTMPTIVLERPLFNRERSDGLYSVITYLSAKMLEELILATGVSLITSLVVFYVLSLQGQWVLFFLAFLVTLSNGIVLAYVVAACAPTMDIANAALPMFVITQMFFTGFLIREADIPVYWRYWAPYADFIRHAWHAQMANQFSRRPDVLFAGVEPVLQYYSIREAAWASLGYASLFFLGFFCFAWLALAFVTHSRR